MSERTRSGETGHCYRMTLLAHPYTSPKVLEAWTGRKRYFELQEADGSHFRDVYPWIKVGFPICGSVNNTEVLIARWMGCAPIILAGVDYCFPGGRIRAQDYRRRGPYIFDPIPMQYCDTQEGKTSASQETLFYANLLLGIWKMYNLPLVQVGDKGACTEIPFVPPEELSNIFVPPEELNNIFQVYGPTRRQIEAIDKSMLEYGMYAEVDERGMGHFRWKEQDESAVESVKLLATADSYTGGFLDSAVPERGGIKDGS